MTFEWFGATSYPSFTPVFDIPLILLIIIHPLLAIKLKPSWKNLRTILALIVIFTFISMMISVFIIILGAAVLAS